MRVTRWVSTVTLYQMVGSVPLPIVTVIMVIIIFSRAELVVGITKMQKWRNLMVPIIHMWDHPGIVALFISALSLFT